MAKYLEKYIDLVYKLLPPGRAWNRSVHSNLYKLVSGFAPEFSRIEERVRDLMRESNPSRCVETLEDWEKLLGLPDSCTINLNLSFEQRRMVVVQKLVAGGGSSIAFFEQIAKIFGYDDIQVNDYKPFRAGRSQAGDQLSGEGWEYTFKVFSENTIINNFKAGKSQAGDQIRTFGDPAMECIIRKVKPAHTTVLFVYGAGEA